MLIVREAIYHGTIYCKRLYYGQGFLGLDVGGAVAVALIAWFSSVNNFSHVRNSTPFDIAISLWLLRLAERTM